MIFHITRKKKNYVILIDIEKNTDTFMIEMLNKPRIYEHVHYQKHHNLMI